MGQLVSLPFRLARTTATYWSGLFHYAAGRGRRAPYGLVFQEQEEDEQVGKDGSSSNSPAAAESTESSATIFAPLRPLPTDTDERRRFKQHARVHLYGLAANFYLYNRPHYRKASYRDDLVDNLRNVAVPGTGVPLSCVAWSRWVAAAFLAVGYPAASLAAALHRGVVLRSGGLFFFSPSVVADEYETRLLAPDDWFSYWRLNCVLVGLHSLLNGGDVADEYAMENKWTFLQEGEARGVPVSPFLAAPEALVVKHKNEEGGLGIYFYRNATFGGDWILQERLHNSDWVQRLLPSDAPLSTFRVITCSRASYRAAAGSTNGGGRGPAVQPQAGDIETLSVVFRAGRKGALTDHDSILFDVDKRTGEIRRGTTNANWYQLGLARALRCPWRSPAHDVTVHPDAPDAAVTGRTVPDIARMLQLVESAHFKLCPRVPMAGWDVVLCKHESRPICLLEVNLSCNFFRGSFDVPHYLDFCDHLLSDLQTKRMRTDEPKEKDKAQ